jgi:hypothetical protein
MFVTLSNNCLGHFALLVGGQQSALRKYNKRAHRKWQMIVTMYNNDYVVEVVGSNATWWSLAEVFKCMHLYDSRCSVVILQSPSLWQSHVLRRTLKSLTSSCLQRTLPQLIPLTATDVSVTCLGKLTFSYRSPKIVHTLEMPFLWMICHFEN